MIDPTELRTREHLTERAVERLIDAAKGIANGCSHMRGKPDHICSA